jgi:hypothetical protein
MIAKVAHAYLAADLGYGAFRPLVRNYILTGNQSDVTRYVGQMDDGLNKDVAGHVIRREVVNFGGVGYHVARVRLFGAYGLPEYAVVAGEVV